MTENPNVRPEEVELCKKWIAAFCKPRTTPNRHGSYTLKHVVERHYGSYVSNDSFIAAAEAMGYAPQYRYPSPNPNFRFWIAVEGFRGSEYLVEYRRPTKGFL